MPLCFIFYISISDFDPHVYYVVLSIRNLVRDDSLIYWKRGSNITQRVCRGWVRCTIALKLEVKDKVVVAPVDFRAITRETNTKLLINDSPVLRVKPSYNRDIVEAALSFPGKQVLCSP